MTLGGLPVGVLADDLIWSTRLVELVRSLGGRPRAMRRLADLEAALGDDVRLVIVDSTALAYDGVDAVRRAVAGGARVLAVGQHDDAALRRRALDAGADRLVPYRTLFERGSATIEAWGRGRPAVHGRRMSAIDGPVSPTIPAARYRERLERARSGLVDHGAAALLIGVGADLRYLTGYAAMPLERLTMLVLGPAGPAILVAPRLEAVAAEACPAAKAGLLRIDAWDETDDPHALVASRLAEATGPGPGTGRFLVSGGLWAMHVLALQRALPGRELGLATEVLRDLRMAKDPDEVALLRMAAHAADRVLGAIAAGPLIGRREIDVSHEIKDRLVAEGHDIGQFAIVASGPNSASPHHDAGERRISAGEPVVLDLGGPWAGYCSDMTRTLWVTGPAGAAPPTDEFLAVYELVRRAQATATAAVRPGVHCDEVDAAARTVIADGGHGPDFIHRVGHGIGLETHEEPYLVAGNGEPLRPGVAFSIEPGIYLAGRFGVRIEDIVVCGPDGADVLNEATRELLAVSG